MQLSFLRHTKVLRALCIVTFIFVGQFAVGQTFGQLKLWDAHQRYPQINEIEFCGADSALATYDAIYGHGAMMENEIFGLRIYMDHRQSIDLYGKQHRQLELAQTNFYSTAADMAKGFGEDILYVGQSVGAGSFRGYEDGQPTYIQPVTARGQRLVSAGPDSVVVEVWDKDWTYKGRTLQMTQRYAMRPGSREVQIDIYLTGASDDMLFATGAQKLELDNRGLMLPKEGIVASWGGNIPDKNHPELREDLGIGVRVPADYLYGVVEDSLNYLCLIHPVNGHMRYYLTVASNLEQTDGFHDADSWFKWQKYTNRPK